MYRDTDALVAKLRQAKPALEAWQIEDLFERLPESDDLTAELWRVAKGEDFCEVYGMIWDLPSAADLIECLLYRADDIDWDVVMAASKQLERPILYCLFKLTYGDWEYIPDVIDEESLGKYWYNLNKPASLYASELLQEVINFKELGGAVLMTDSPYTLLWEEKGLVIIDDV